MSKTAFIFPGQGAQKRGMGKDFYENSATAAKEIFDTGNRQSWDIDMTKLCFEENEQLDQTEYTQAAMVTACLAMTAEIEEERSYTGCDSRAQPWRVLCDQRSGRHAAERRHFSCEKKRDF